MEGGEACCSDENDSSTIDPDFALSYIDEKLQDVLGQFHKDFEGGAENLGARFGAYGSFLPAYQQSPSWSHPRTPPEDNHHGSRSPYNGQLQNGRTISLYSSPGIISSNCVNGLRPAFCIDQRNQGVHPLPYHGKELTSKSELPRSTDLFDKKSLKVRIKVGKDDLSSRKNAKIYSGLGLDVSPSSSLNESLVKSEGLSHDLLDVPDESLSRIIQIMTSATLFERLLLTPLSDELICLTEKERITGEREPNTEDTSNQGSSRMVANGSDLKITDRKMFRGNKPKVTEQSLVSVSPVNDSEKYVSHATSVVPKKETDMDSLFCELISDTLILPLLSDVDVADLKKDSMNLKFDSIASGKGKMENDFFSDVVGKELHEPVASLDNGWANRSTKKSRVSGKAVESRKVKCSSVNLAYHKREVNCMDEKDELSMKSGEHVGPDEMSVREDTVHTSHQIVNEKILVYSEDGSKLPPGESQLSSGHKKRENGDQSIAAQDVMYPEDGMLNYSVKKAHQSKRSSNLSSIATKSNSEDLMSGLGKAVGKYKERLEDLELEKDRDNIQSEETSSIQLVKGSQVLLDKRSLDTFVNVSKEKPMEKKSEDLYPLDSRGLASNVTHHAGKCSTPAAALTAVAPLHNEDWVCCDKCQKWRLLPLGTNPKGLPEKWVCSMLDWLPGMNHCGISQDATTLSLRSAQASSTSGSKYCQHPLSSVNNSVVSLGDARRSTDVHQGSDFQETTGVKKNHAAKYVTKETNPENSPFVRNSKKRLHESTKTRSLNDIDNSPFINDVGYRHAGQSSFLLENRAYEENQTLQNYSDKADILKSKTKSMKDNEVSGMRASKKMKMGDAHQNYENCTSYPRLCNIAPEKDCHGSNRFRNSKGGMKLSGSFDSDDSSQHLAAHCLEDNMKRRKGNDALESDVTDPENHSLRSRDLLKGCNETEERIQKKARVSKSEGKDCKENTHYSGSAKKIYRGTKDILGHDLVSTASQQSTDAIDPLRRDLGALQPTVAATSSSSKVSRSLRSKANLHEMKGSPVESVSSSPLRASNVLHFNHTRLSSHDEPIFDRQTEKMRSDDNMHLLGSVNNNTKTSCFPSNRLTHSNVNSPDQGMHKAWQIETLDQSQNEKNERERVVSRHAGHSKKAGKGFSARSKEKKKVSRSVCDNDKVTHFDPIDAPSHEEKSKAGSNKSQGKFSISCDRTDKSHVSSKDSAGNPDSGNCKDEIPSKVEVHDGTGASKDVIACQDMKQRVKHNSEFGRFSRSLYSEKIITEDSERGKSSTKQPSLRGQSDSTTNLKPVVELKTEEGDCANENDEQSKALKQSERLGKDSSSQAFANAVKEAKDLKHLADRFKNSGSTTDRTGIYFQAALKFLHGASLLESCSSENGKQTKIQSMEMYSSTAKLCEFCAHEYEKSRDMAAAALAYKCVEVAYMRVIYTSHTGVSKVRNEVQTALQLIPTGDSPSSSASDIDNFNNAAIIDKAIASKGIGSPQVVGTQVLTARTRTSCMHLIQFVQEVTSAMEASRKSRSRLGEAQNKEGISSVKRALDFNFQDVDGLLHLVRMAIEAINR